MCGGHGTGEGGVHSYEYRLVNSNTSNGMQSVFHIQWRLCDFGAFDVGFLLRLL